MGRLPLSADKRKSAQINVNMTQQEFSNLYYITDRLGVTPQDFIRDAINTVYDGFIEAERKEKLA